VFVTTVPVLPGLPAGLKTATTVDLTNSNLNDASGNPYTLTVTPGLFQVGGTLSIQNVVPGGGFLPAGTVLQVTGSGFDASTTVNLDGVAVAAPQVVSGQQLNLTLDGPMEPTGKHLHVGNSAGEQVDYFLSLPSVELPNRREPAAEPNRQPADAERRRFIFNHGLAVSKIVAYHQPGAATA